MGIYGNAVLNPKSYLGVSEILEKYEWLKMEDCVNVLTEAELNNKLNSSVDDFIRDGSEYIEATKKNKCKNKQVAKGFLLLAAGFSITSLLITASLPLLVVITVILGIIMAISSLLLSIYFTGAATYKGAIYLKDVNSLKMLRKDVVRVRDVSKNPEEIVKLTDMIYIIDDTVEKISM